MRFKYKELMDAYDNKVLYVQALITMSDEIGVYCYKDRFYKVIYIGDKEITIECECSRYDEDNYIIDIDDKKFKLAITADGTLEHLSKDIKGRRKNL